MKIRTTPLPFQRDGIDKMHQFNGRVLLADDMGLGKTFQSLCFTAEAGAFPCVVVCPAAVKYNWQLECKKHLGVRADVLSGRTPDKSLWDTRCPRFTIINYEILDAWLPYFRKIKPQCVILDECQYLGNKTSKRTKAVSELLRGPITKGKRKRIPHVLALSGTPFTNRPINLFPILQLLVPSVFNSRLEFGETYCEPVIERGRRVYKGGRNLGQLRQLLKATCMIRRRKVAVLEQLPSLTRSIVSFELSPKDRATYNKATRDITTLMKAMREVGRDRRNAMQGHFTRLKMLVAELKMKSVYQWIDEFLENTTEKLVVFGVHKKILEPLHAHYKNSILVTGKVSGKKRQVAIDMFRRKDDVRLLFGNLKAAGVGVNGLQDVCRQIAMIELGWDPATHTQAEARVWRMGQMQGCMVHYLLAKNTMEEVLCQLIQRKSAWFEEAIDGEQHETEKLDLLQLLEQHVTERK